MSTIVAFDRKGDLVDCQTLANPRLPVLVLRWQELQIAMLQPVPGMALNAFITVMVELLAGHFHLFASRRLMLDSLQSLYAQRRALGTWPTLTEWIEQLERMRVNALSRAGQYREALLYALKALHTETSDVLNYAQSNVFERMFSTRGCFVVQTAGLSVESASLLASLVVNWIYEYRGVHGRDVTGDAPVIVILDDAMPLVTGSVVAESEGGISPLSSWMLLGRSRRIGFVVSCQNFALISPACRNNADTVLCFGSYGRDAEELARYWNLNREQAVMLSVIRPGSVIACARSVWPLAVWGGVAELP